ncbi:hypothetical protein HDEF_1756 [Candidatus Hamiltonella defensa 5AT (Acyrthosiphon pisum)]|uniref:Uncharacterized protein n=1 Tax=Hamiltonella defensa subsp. Acyrthosiphon pisum (strain 5AT) TaxID=572265 RepID=C4K709_HAMD5|nr:hypothetical protein HDEF_1756 [Candidatus Hamiltonella defensa 5AT (Acyrthosiphon pisum)]
MDGQKNYFKNKKLFKNAETQICFCLLWCVPKQSIMLYKVTDKVRG